MQTTCKGITLNGEKCSRKVRDADYCFQHSSQANSSKYAQQKPENCPVCYDSLDNQKNALQCGHWVHTKCVIQSGKEECPVCRSPLQLKPRAKKKLQKIRQLLRQEQLAEEEEELQDGLRDQVQHLIAPTLRERIYGFVDEMLYEMDIDDIIYNGLLDH